MSLHRRNPRRDASEAAIIDTLLAAGWSVARLSGKDQPDLAAGKHGITLLIEVKTGTKPLRPGQERWWAAWNGNPKLVLRTVDDVLELCKTAPRAERRTKSSPHAGTT